MTHIPGAVSSRYYDLFIQHVEDAGGHFGVAALHEQVEFFVQLAFLVHLTDRLERALDRQGSARAHPAV